MSDWAVITTVGIITAYKAFTHWIDSRHTGERESHVGVQAELAEPVEPVLGFRRDDD